ncbi:hypothetical protein QRB41_26605 [Mycobacterium avium subsp. hominissuis]|uniref:Uncharacterized protein n=1 Tax=Mycobacterium avium TaxID=1764 RepID=A0A2A2ZAU2_MYCAV|nr:MULTISPECIES: hypothetical protein [Mycobacteriaceae]MDO2386900.1 hypothetical protein [Mycobacterium avium subsp. hominissuis]MDO2395386.1 hypothetical protein [Mycobacterium avium subsp. hominissuis]PBA23589.1 hypothetical protein CKJ66_27485 [Mycobacterium avium]RUP32649.1 MAG: hypothetical protein EKK51_09170 [Mycolicibacterium sp.]
MTDAPSLSERRPPARRQDNKVAEYAFLVRVPGKPWDNQVFLPDAADKAAQYAADTGTTVEDLPMGS